MIVEEKKGPENSRNVMVIYSFLFCFQQSTLGAEESNYSKMLVLMHDKSLK
jgi:hypothetical protein